MSCPLSLPPGSSGISIIQSCPTCREKATPHPI